MSTDNGAGARANLAMSFAAGDPDLWDDRELIRAYDHAIRNWRREDKGKVASEETPGPGPWMEVSEDAQSKAPIAEPSHQLTTAELLEVGSWIIGAPCRALYSEDGLEYEAKIIGIEGPQCTVRFVGYGNEEQVNLLDLKTTHGKQSRARQRQEAFQNQPNPTGRTDVEEMTDRISNVSMTSSMCNNYSESVCRDGDLLEDTLTDTRQPIQASTPRSILFNTVLKSKQTSSSLAKLRMAKPGSLPAHSIDTVDSAIPSCVEATIDSSSSVSSIVEEPQEPPVNMTNGDWENFNNTMPQFRFPVPPMPLSLSNKDGGFDFGRGELPSLLMSWYMAGYQSGFYDAKHEMASNASRNRGNQEERMHTSKSSKRLV